MFETIGRDIFVSRLISSHGGNMSVREGDAIYITRTGSQLGRLKESDIVRVELERETEADREASAELVVHRAIYKATGAGAVVHTHSPHTIWRSFVDKVIKPIDSEALLFMPEVPIVSSEKTVGSAEAGELLGSALRDHRVAVLRTHGPFSCAATLEEAYRWISVLECSCELLDLRDSRTFWK